MKGFILLEVLISIALSALIFTSLTTALFQLHKAKTVLDDTVQVHTRVATLLSLLQKDIQGATIPVSAMPTESKPEPPSTAVNISMPTGIKVKEEPKLLTHVFYGTQKEQNIETLSCITTNPSKIYWSSTAGKAKPCVMRVVYTLSPDPLHKESFILKRQEGSSLKLDTYTNQQEKPRAYEVIEGIKSLRVTYGYKENTSEKDAKTGEKPSSFVPQKTTNNSPEQKIEYKEVQEWIRGEEKEKDEEKNKKPSLPAYVKVIINLWNSSYKKEYLFEYVIDLPTQYEQQIKQAKMRYVKNKSETAHSTVVNK